MRKTSTKGDNKKSARTTMVALDLSTLMVAELQEIAN